MFKKFYLSLTICFKSIFKIKGDIIDGIYNNKDSQDETELVSFLGNSMSSDENIIHPYQEDVRVIFHSGNKGYKYNKLAESPDSPNSPNSPDSLVCLNKIKMITNQQDIIPISDQIDTVENEINDHTFPKEIVSDTDTHDIFHDSLDE